MFVHARRTTCSVVPENGISQFCQFVNRVVSGFIIVISFGKEMPPAQSGRQFLLVVFALLHNSKPFTIISLELLMF